MNGDPENLARILRNVTENAVRHARHSILVRTSTTPDAIHVVITDDGPGVPVDERERVFDRFVRLDASRKHARGSTSRPGDRQGGRRSTLGRDRPRRCREPK